MRTLIQIEQAINNVTRQNTNGQFDARLKELESEKRDVQLWIRSQVVPVAKVYEWSPLEMAAVTGFNKDTRFTITE